MQERCPIIQSKITVDSKILTDGFKTYDGLLDWGYRKHHRVKHGENEFANSHSHINAIENFWGWQ